MKSKLILVTVIVLSVFLAVLVTIVQGTSGFDGYTRNGLQTLNSGDPNYKAAASYLKQDQFIDVRWYGAIPNDDVNDTAAIRVAIAAIASNSHLDGLTTYSKSRLHFPQGVWNVGAALTADADNTIQYVEVTGDNAILVLAAGVVCFGGVGTETNFRGLQFHGGETAISIKTANLDTSKISISKCIFLSQTGFSVQVDTASDSTHLRIDDCKFLCNYSATQRVLSTGVAQASLSRCWIGGATGTPISLVGGRLHIVDSGFYPNGITAWVEQTDGILKIDRCDFSGEDGGGCIVDFNAPAGTLRIENSSLTSNDAAIRFYALPKYFTWENNDGTMGSGAEGGVAKGGFWYSPDVNQIDVNDLWANDSQIRIDGQRPSDSNSVLPAVAMYGVRQPRSIPAAYPADANLALVIPADTGSYGLDYSYTRCSGASVGDPIWGMTGTEISATADDATGSIYFNTALNGLAQGDYTLVQPFAVKTSSTVTVSIYAGERVTTLSLGPGFHTLTAPFQFHDTQRVGLSVRLPRNGDQTWQGPTRLFTGFWTVGSLNNVTYATAAPAALQRYIGDVVINQDPDAGEASGWVCTVDGAPGTWVDQITAATTGLAVKNGATSAGYIDLYENSDAGTNKVRLAGQTLAADANSFCVYTKQVDLTNANIKALAAGVELVAAPGAGRWLELVSASLWLDYGSEVLAEPSTPDDLAIEYDTGTGPAASATIVASGFITAAADTGAFAVPVSIAGTAAASLVNKNLAIINTGTDYTGNISNNTVMRVIVNYRIHDSLGL